jgi:hypothetical protein
MSTRRLLLTIGVLMVAAVALVCAASPGKPTVSGLLPLGLWVAVMTAVAMLATGVTPARVWRRRRATLADPVESIAPAHPAAIRAPAAGGPRVETPAAPRWVA